MEIFCWGTRGSIATPGPKTVIYGGNTTCVEIRDGNEFIIIDCGTGLKDTGYHILKQYGPKNKIPILITHTHWDHIQGFPFFVPVFIPGNEITIWGPYLFDTPFEKVIMNQMQYSYFPVNFSQLGSKISFEVVATESPFRIGSITVKPMYVNHPIRTLAYRFEKDGKSIVFMTDIEPYSDVIFNGICPNEEEREEFEEVQETVKAQNQRIIDFCKGATILMMDAQYTKEEYKTKVGWGHTSMEDAIEIAQKAGVRDLLFFHHDPLRTDEQMTKLVEDYRQKISQPLSSLQFLDAAKELTSYKA